MITDQTWKTISYVLQEKNTGCWYDNEKLETIPIEMDCVACYMHSYIHTLRIVMIYGALHIKVFYKK